MNKTVQSYFLSPCPCQALCWTPEPIAEPQELSAWVTGHDTTQQDASGQEAGHLGLGQWSLPGQILERFMEVVT